MIDTHQHHPKKQHTATINSLVNDFIQKLNQNLIANNPKISKLPTCGYVQRSLNHQQQPSTKIQLILCQGINNTKIDAQGKLQEQVRNHQHLQRAENQKQPLYCADFQTYHSLEGESNQKTQKPENNKEYKQNKKKSGANSKEMAKIVENIKRNIRVHNKSSTNINKSSQVKQSMYNELRDKTLVQYFYPRQKKIFRDNSNKIEHSQIRFNYNSKEPENKQSKLAKKCKSVRHKNMAFCIKMKKQSSYKIKNDCGRKIAFDNYDLVSCNLSMRQYHSNRTQKVMEHILKGENENGEPVQCILQHRIKNIEQKVYKKMPFLVQMGVKFKTAKLRL